MTRRVDHRMASWHRPASLDRVTADLAEDAVIGSHLGESIADGALDREVGFGDVGAVGFRLDVEVDGTEPRERDGVGEIGEFEREFEVGGVVGHPSTLSTHHGRSFSGSIGATGRSPDNVVPRFGL